MVAPSALRFIGLNFLRLVSVSSLILVFAAVIDIMVLDARAIKALSADEKTQALEECDYFGDTSVPTHVWGLFWVQLQRFFLLLLLIACFCSEINWGGLAERLFSYNVPILGSGFSTAPLGLVQMMIGASLLSTHLWLFPLVSAWLLFFCGFFNVVSGMIFRAPGRDMRSILASRRKRVAAPKPRTTPPAMSSLANLGASAVDKLRRKRVTPRKAPAAAPPMTTRELKSFPSLETVSHAELLRQRAREANLRAEREEEARERRVRELRELMALDDAQEAAADKDLERGLSDAFEWNEAHGLPFPRTAEMARQQQAELAQRQQPSTSASKPAAPTQGAAADASTVARAQAGANADLEPWRRSTHSASSKKRRAAAGGLSGAREIAARGTAAVRRRNLVLSRHLRELRLGAAPKARKNAAPPLPKAPHMRVAPSPGAASAFSAQSHYASADEANPDDDDDDDDQLIFVGAPPLPAYVPGGTRIVRADIEHTRDDAPVLPVAKQWASEWASAPALPSERAQHSVTRKAVPRRHIPSSGPPI